MARQQKIKDAGDNVAIWGCEFRKLLRDNPELENETCSYPYVKSSPIGGALYGGRTETNKTWYKTKQGEKCSM